MPIDPQIRRKLPVAIDDIPVLKLLGIELVALGSGTSTCFLDADERFHNAMGSMHGGILGDLADVAMGSAVVSTLAGDETYTTVEMKVNYLRPHFRGQLRATGKVPHRGKSIAYAEAEIVNEEGKAVARASSTNLVLKRAGDANPFHHKPK